jgi:ABC-2 type transport system permease protein
MAGLTDTASPSQNQPWISAQSRAQFAALAQLRWCIFRNAFRRKGGVGELIARIFIFPILAAIAIFPIVGAGFGTYLLVSTDRLAMLSAITWGVFLLWQLVVLNISAPGLSFDINTIIRFPLSFPRYLTARLFFGLLSAANVIGTLALIAADIGIGVAKPSLIPWATLVLSVFAMANIFFTRMAITWVERWLSTRRASEIFTALIIFGSLGFQYINLNFNPAFQNGHVHKSPVLIKIFSRLRPVADLLPPGLAAISIVSSAQARHFDAIASLLGLATFGCLFLAIYAWRMHREFRGENLSQVSQQPSATRIPPTPRISSLPSATDQSTRRTPLGLSPTLSACLHKELIYLRRNTNQLYGFIAPVFMVFLFATRIAASGTGGSLVFPASVAYSLLGVSILSYNGLGMDGAGVQFYFISPTRIRDVFLAKNLIGFLLSFIEFVLIFGVLAFGARTPTPLTAVATLCWLLFTNFTNGAIGNLRSLSAPKKINLSKISRTQTSQLSALIALGVVLGCFAIGFATVLLCQHLGQPWLMIPILVAFAVAAFIFYIRVLNRLDAIALNHREAIAEELCKT